MCSVTQLEPRSGQRGVRRGVPGRPAGGRGLGRLADPLHQRPWTERTVTPIASTSKALASVGGADLGGARAGRPGPAGGPLLAGVRSGGQVRHPRPPGALPPVRGGCAGRADHQRRGGRPGPGPPPARAAASLVAAGNPARLSRDDLRVSRSAGWSAASPARPWVSSSPRRWPGRWTWTSIWACRAGAPVEVAPMIGPSSRQAVAALVNPVWLRYAVALVNRRSVAYRATFGGTRSASTTRPSCSASRWRTPRPARVGNGPSLARMFAALVGDVDGSAADRPRPAGAGTPTAGQRSGRGPAGCVPTGGSASPCPAVRCGRTPAYPGCSVIPGRAARWASRTPTTAWPSATPPTDGRS